LIVNVASTCGFTTQYGGLQDLYDKYKGQGLEVLGFPTDQFYQEPRNDEEVARFCTRKYGVSFPLMKKSDVNGSGTNEVFKWLKSEKPGLLWFTRIKWNFEKFLVDKNGEVVGRWTSLTTPSTLDAEIEKII